MGIKKNDPPWRVIVLRCGCPLVNQSIDFLSDGHFDDVVDVHHLETEGVIQVLIFVVGLLTHVRFKEGFVNRISFVPIFHFQHGILLELITEIELRFGFLVRYEGLGDMFHPIFGGLKVPYFPFLLPTSVHGFFVVKPRQDFVFLGIGVNTLSVVGIRCRCGIFGFLTRERVDFPIVLVLIHFDGGDRDHRHEFTVVVPLQEFDEFRPLNFSHSVVCLDDKGMIFTHIIQIYFYDVDNLWTRQGRQPGPILELFGSWGEPIKTIRNAWEFGKNFTFLHRMATQNEPADVQVPLGDGHKKPRCGHTGGIVPLETLTKVTTTTGLPVCGVLDGDAPRTGLKEHGGEEQEDDELFHCVDI